MVLARRNSRAALGDPGSRVVLRSLAADSPLADLADSNRLEVGTGFEVGKDFAVGDDRQLVVVRKGNRAVCMATGRRTIRIEVVVDVAVAVACVRAGEGRVRLLESREKLVVVVVEWYRMGASPMGGRICSSCCLQCLDRIE